jgi:23S rRNA (cytosine1962-C5)-methyltransferase
MLFCAHDSGNQKQKDYELIDSGNGKKLERYGDFILSRPDPQALWQPLAGSDVWSNAHASFIRDGKNAKWAINKNKGELPKSWNMPFAGLVFEIRPTSFKHTGIFPEHKENWNWMKNLIVKSKRPIKVLNLFGYTREEHLWHAHRQELK